MLKKIFIIPIFFAGLSVTAQVDDQSKFASSITTESLKKHLTIIAGAEMEGRETGTAGERKAAAYIESQFKSLGLIPAPGLKGYQQYFPLYKDSLVKSQLEIADKEMAYGTDYIVQGSKEEVKFKGRKIVFAGYGIETPGYNDYNGLDVKGKVILIFLGEPKADGKYLISGTNKSSDWSFPGLPKKLALASEKGAAGVIVVSPSTAVFTSRSVESSKKTNPYFPKAQSKEVAADYVYVSHTVAKNILGDRADSLIAFAKGSGMFSKSDYIEKSIEVDYKYKKSREIINSSNVIGVIEGTDKKDEYLFLTAHYDHLGIRDGKIFYGADDDGSGTVAVMEMAAAFAKAKAAGNGPRRTVVFMTFSGEEKGLWGSEYYSENPVYPLDKTTANLNTDMVGRIDSDRKAGDSMNYVYVIGHDKLSSDLPIINEGVNNKYTKLEFDYKFDDPADVNRIYFRSDHYNFARKGVPVLFFYDGMLHADYHKSSDTIDKITWPLYEKRVHMIFHTAWEIANRNDMLKRDVPLNMGTR